MSLRRRKALKWLLVTLASLVVVVGLLLIAFSFVVGRVPEYRVQLQSWLNERTGVVVEFRTLGARLRLYGPEIVFDDAVVRTPDRTRVLATARRGSVGFDIWNCIATGRLIAGRFSLESPQIGLIRTLEGRIQLVGQSALPERNDAKPFAIENLPTGRFTVKDAVVSFRDEITGRGPWSLSGVNFDLQRDGDSLRLRGDASLPSGLGSALEFSATAQGALELPHTVVSTFEVGGRQLDLAGWADVFPDEWPAPETGRGALQLHGALHGLALTQLSAKVDFVDVATALPQWSIPLPVAAPLVPRRSEDEEHTESEPVAQAVPEAPEAQPEPDTVPTPPEMLSYGRLAFAFNLQRLDQTQWSAQLSNLEVTRGDSAWHAAKIAATWSKDENGRIQARGSADRVVLQNIWPLLAYLPESETLAHLRALSVSGAIQDLSLSLQRDAAAAPPQYSVQARLDDFGFKPVKRAPGLTGLSGQLQATQAGGQVRLASKNARFELPRMFRDVLVAQSVDGVLSWTRDDTGLTIHSDEIQLSSEDGNARARVHAFVPSDGSSPLLDLSAQGENLQVSATRKYLPADQLGPKTLEWFERALVDGRVVTAEFIFKGPSRQFPFRKGEGTFIARGAVEDAVFDYQEGWPRATGLMADVEFRNQGMHIRASQASVAGLTVGSASADIEDFRQNDLLIKANAAGDLQQGLQLLKDSPLGPKLGAQFARLQGSGALQADVRLFLPIRHLSDRDIEVNAKLADAGVSMQGLDAPVSKLAGTLTIRNTLPAAARLRGQWLGGSIDLGVRSQNKSTAILTAQGRAQAAQLHPALHLPSAVKVSGAMSWRVATTLRADDEQQAERSNVRIDADLRGFGIHLPQPLGKPEDAPQALRLDLEFDRGQQILARGSLGDVRTLIRLQQWHEGWTLDRGGVRADGNPAALPDHPGLRIEGAVERFVLDEWLQLKGPAGAKRLSDYLRAANVRVGSFELFGYRWPDVRGILQATPQGWRVDVSGSHATGQLLIPENFNGAPPLRATLERLVLEKAQGGEQSDDEISDPRNLPNLDLHIGDMRVGQRTLGAVDLKATRVPQGIHLDKLSISGASAHGEARGKWLATSQGQQSSLEATATSTDVAATLTALGYTPFMQAEKGSINATLSWPGGFDDNLLERASGTISVAASTGQLVNLQPGAGRVLGLFSVAALPRRLALDFSDLTEKGLAFDSVHGDFELRNGNAYTENLLLRGPAAEIGIAGRTGLGTRDYDQTAVVTGNLGASLPVAGALAGGPAIGAALLLFSQVFKEPLKGITRGYYRISGPWDNPVVERVNADAVKEAAANAEAASG